MYLLLGTGRGAIIMPPSRSPGVPFRNPEDATVSMVAHGCQLSAHTFFFTETGSHYVARLVLDYSSTVTSKVLDYRLLPPWPHCNTFSSDKDNGRTPTVWSPCITSPRVYGTKQPWSCLVQNLGWALRTRLAASLILDQNPQLGISS